MSRKMSLIKQYYEHKYTPFDHLCNNFEDVSDCIQMYISKGLSTPDFEAEKYIIFSQYKCLEYVLRKYKINNWLHLVATCIFNKCHPTMLKCVLDYHIIKTGNPLEIDPLKDDIMWLCVSTGSLHSAVIMNSVCDIKNIDLACSSEMHWNYLDPTNPRNLVYAIKYKRVNDAIQLIENGCQVDVWNNLPMAICFGIPELKKESRLIKSLFTYGAKIPKYVHEYFTIQNKESRDSGMVFNLA
jgi:hypothetical protein